MLKRITIFSFCFISVCVILFSMCPISVFAAPTVYYPIASDKPPVNEYSGYVELLFENNSSGQRFVTVLGWTFTPYVNTSAEHYATSDKPLLTIVRNESQFRLGVASQEYVSGCMSFITIDSGSQLYFGVVEIADDESTFYYNVTYGSDYSLVGMHYYGDFTDVNVSNALPNEEFYVTYGSDTVISYGLNQVISGIYSMIDLLDNESYAGQLGDILSKLNSIDSSITDFKSAYEAGLTQLFGLFRGVINNLETLVYYTDELETKLDEIWELLFNIYNSVSNIEYYMPYVYGELLDIDTKLQLILDILNASGDNGEKLTQPDNSDMDNYYDLENGLINNDSADVGDTVDVSLNQNAMNVIWGLVERGLNSNSKVIGMVITVLALGIVALILGR